MEKKYKLESLFVGPINQITDEYVDQFEYEQLDNEVVVKDNECGYTNISKQEHIYSSNNMLYKVDNKFVYETDLVLFKEYLKNKGIGVNKESLTKDEILQLYEMSKNNEVENTLAIIKPDGMFHIEEIIAMFYQNGLKIKDFKVEQLSEEKIEEHYAHLLDKPFYPKLRDYMMCTPVALMVLEGKNAVENLRNLMGPTDAAKAESNTIRGKFGTDITHNAIHGSDSKENAEIEINRFFNQKQKVK